MPDRRSLVDRLLEAYDRTGILPAISGGDHDEDPPQDDPPKDDPKPTKPEGITDEIQAYFSNIVTREARKAADKAKADVQAELDRKRQQDEAERKRKDDEAKGDFEQVKTSLTSERDTAISERDAYKSELDEYRALVTADLDAQWKALPEEVREAYDGEDDDVLAKKRHIVRMAKVIEKLSEKPTIRGSGPSPKPGTTGVDEAAALSHVRQTVRPI